MHPFMLAQFGKIQRKNPAHPALATMTKGQHFLVGCAMNQLAVAVTNQIAHSNGPDLPGNFTAPVTARLPAAVTCITFEEKPGQYVNILCKRPEDRPDWILVSVVTEGCVISLGGFVPGSDRIQRFLEGTPEELYRAGAFDDVSVGKMVFKTAILLSLINTPRKIIAHEKKEPSWKLRKEIEDVTGEPAVGYFSVGWEIGKAIRAQGGSITTNGHPKALHWARSYWAVANEGEPKAEWLNLETKGGWGWYRWVADSWRGHPDYGVLLHHYEPRVKGQEKRPGQFVSFVASSAERLAMMSEAKRSALIQAGFAA